MASTRRSFLGSMVNGLYGAALAALFSQDLYNNSKLFAGETPQRRGHNLLPKPPHFRPKAKAVIQLMMQGGPSQVDLFDPKPELDKNHGKSILGRIAKDLVLARCRGRIDAKPL